MGVTNSQHWKADSGKWRVMRLDDNGNTLEVAVASCEAEAETIAAAFEARGHKQTYWIEPATLASGA